jgi:hypothetical protein
VQYFGGNKVSYPLGRKISIQKKNSLRKESGIGYVFALSVLKFKLCKNHFRYLVYQLRIQKADLKKNLNPNTNHQHCVRYRTLRINVRTKCASADLYRYWPSEGRRGAGGT